MIQQQDLPHSIQNITVIDFKARTEPIRKKEKLIFLMPILEIKTKNPFSAGKGTRVLVPGHQNSGAPTFFWGFS